MAQSVSESRGAGGRGGAGWPRVFGALSLGGPGPQTGRQLQEEAGTTDVEASATRGPQERM